MALLRRLRGKPKADGAPQSGAAQMKMLRRLPQILRFIPGAAQDMRVYFLTLQYWLAGSEDNIANLLRLLVERYAGGPRRGLREVVKSKPPVQYPELGVYHPALRERMSEDVTPLPRDGRHGTVGLLLMRSYLLAGNAGHYDGVIAALEARGLNVIPAFASGLDARPAVERFFLDAQGRSRVDAVVSLTGFSLVGGPAYNDAKAAEEMLARLDVPYLAAMPVEFQSLSQWQGSARAPTVPRRAPRTTWWSRPSAPRCWPRGWRSGWRCAVARMPSERSASCCSTSPPMRARRARRPSCRSSNRCSICSLP
jgi:magnesium chelatase subunit H